MSSMISTNNVKYSPILETLNLWPSCYIKGQLIFSLLTRRMVVFLLIIHLLVVPFSTIDCDVERVYISQKEIHKTLAETTRLDITWTSRLNLQPTPIEPGDRIAGDHIIVKSVWHPSKSANWTYLSINATPIPALLEVETNTNVAEIDTRFLGNNATCVINATIGLTNGSIVSKILNDIFLGNFFTPSIVVLSPNGGEVWTGTETITWLASDLNADEHLTYEVLLFSGTDKNLQLLAKGLNETQLEWNFSGLHNLSTYKIVVRATDGIYTSIDSSDAFFTAGDVYPTITSTMTTTTTMTPYDIRVIGFLVILMVSSVIIALVAYYTAKKL